MLSLIAIATAMGTYAAGPAGYLFVTFGGQPNELNEQIYFSTSRDGREWTLLNNGDPVLVSDIGTKGVRDPYLLRSHDGRKFYIIATDLSTHYLHNWGRAVREGSHSLVIWESSDLVNWSEPRLVDVAPDDAGCTWAPEAIYDEENGDYLVFWASTTARDGFRKQRIWAARTKDFKTFGEPFIYIEKPNAVIDTTIVRDGKAYYRFTKDERHKSIFMETAPRLSGPWTDVPGYNLGKLTGYEGPEIYQLEAARPGKPSVWGLIFDNYGDRGYVPWITTNLAEGKFQPAEGFSFPFKFRHGFVLPLTAKEYKTIMARWPGNPVVSLSPYGQPERTVRHGRFHLRLDENVSPAEDGRWLLASGLDGGSDTVSFRSANFPDHYINPAAEGINVLPNDGTRDFAEQTSFVRVPGLASKEGVSFRLKAEPDHYLKAGPSGVTIGPVSTSADRESATFKLSTGEKQQAGQGDQPPALVPTAEEARPINVEASSDAVVVPVQGNTDLRAFDPLFAPIPNCEVAPIGPQNFSAGPVSYTLTPADGSPVKKINVSVVARNNPVIPGYFADPDIIYSQKNKRFYLYPTTDGVTDWNGSVFHTFSSGNLVDWKDEGVILDLGPDVSWANRRAWAPCIIEKKVRNEYRYFYYFCGEQKIGVAVASDPAGPFKDSGRPMIDKLPAGVRWGQQIDPAVFRDPKSGKYYLYWGNNYLAVAELSDDMLSIKEDTIKIMTPDKTFREGITVFFRKGRYYFLWSEDDTRSPNYRVRYAVSKSPTGPLTIPENNIVIEKKPEDGIHATGHNSTIQIPGRDEWYIVYHRFNYPKGIDMGREAGYHREVCIDKMEFDADGHIIQVTPTHKGIEPVELRGSSH